MKTYEEFMFICDNVECGETCEFFNKSCKGDNEESKECRTRRPEITVKELCTKSDVKAQIYNKYVAYIRKQKFEKLLEK